MNKRVETDKGVTANVRELLIVTATLTVVIVKPLALIVDRNKHCFLQRFLLESHV